MALECLFGAVADDFTGGADLAGMLSERGVRTLQLFGVDHAPEILNRAREYQAVVVCLKTRSIPASHACEQSLEALRLLQRLHARQIQFKYCSTFDSTEQGNIGPVADALMSALDADFTIAVPALPVNRRTQYLGYLFVGGQLLSESPMRHHPLNPMTDSNLVRFLGKQTQRRVGLIDLHTLRSGCFQSDAEIALVDAVDASDLERIAEAAVDLPLLTGGSGLGMALPRIWCKRGWLDAQAVATNDSKSSPALILAGSCSAATLRQLEQLEASGCPVFRLDVRTLDADAAVSWALPHLNHEGLACIRSSAGAEERTAGVSGEAIESAFARIAQRIVREHNVTRIVVAGGETSGAVVNALGITAAEVTSVIDPGVPAIRTLSSPPLTLALKSGNFGAPDFFRKALQA